MADDNIHTGDVGTQLVVTVTDELGVAVDVSSATTRTILLRRPGRSGTVLSKSAVNDTDGTNGKIRYDTLAGDIDRAGVWAVQGYVELAGGQKWHTAESEFLVLPNLDD